MDPIVFKIVSRYKAAQQAPEDDDDDKDIKKGEWNLTIRKYSASRWSYFLRNPKGGGGGSTSYPNQKAAIAAALGRGVKDTMGKDKVWVIIRAWDPEAEDYRTTKTYWEDLKEAS